MMETDSGVDKPGLSSAAASIERAPGPVALLDFEPSLIEWVPESRRDIARRALIVTAYGLGPGLWDGPELDPAKGFGFLIGSGFVVRELHIDGSRSLEPLGPGDIVRPWQEDAASFAHGEIRLLTNARVAVLDREFALRAARIPELIAGLLVRVMLRSRYLAVYAAIDGLVGVPKRLIMLMWTFAERGGELRTDGIFLPLEFHHSALAYLVAARRPSVSTALSELQAARILRRVEGGWMLHGDPPPAVDRGPS
jgi:hypothetical protein